MGYRKIPSLNWLRVFEAAAQTGSFSAAARILNMSPSAVSQQIHALERHLQAQLFHRGPKSVRLAEAGYLFLPNVRQALTSVEATASSIFGLGSHERLSLHAPTVFVAGWLPPRLMTFEERHPKIFLTIASVDRFPDAAQEAADIGISFGPAARQWGEATPLFSETIYPVALPAVAGTIRTASDLAGHTLIEVSGHRQSWLQLLASLRVSITTELAFTFTSTSVLALSLAAGGAGIALARAPATDWLVERLGLQPCLAGAEMKGEESYYLAMRPAGSRQGSAALFHDWIVEQARS